jgi:hypothetical protein
VYQSSHGLFWATKQNLDDKPKDGGFQAGNAPYRAERVALKDRAAFAAHFRRTRKSPFGKRFDEGSALHAKFVPNDLLFL